MLQLNTAASHEDPGPAATTADQNAKLSTGMPCKARGCFTFLGSASSSNMGFLEWQAAAVLFLALQIGLCCCGVAFLSEASCWSLISSAPPHCIIRPGRTLCESVSPSLGSSLTEASCSRRRQCDYSILVMTFS